MTGASDLRRVCVVTGTRAEYGIFRRLMRVIAEGPGTQLQVIATAAHLSNEFGYTVEAIAADGFSVDAKVHMLLSSDDPVAIAKSIGLGIVGLADAFAQLVPDIVVLLGDRYEILAAATAAATMRLPIAHIHGGEISEGALDESYRHAVSKLSHLHFVATEQFRLRLIRMGEAPERVFTVGAPALDGIQDLALPGKSALAERTKLPLSGPLFLLTYHPETLGSAEPVEALQKLLDALDRFPEAELLFTKANADAGGRAINDRLRKFVAGRAGRAALVDSLGQEFYFSALKHAAVVIGNSSSGIIEAPAFGTPTVNIGARQQGRPRAATILDCTDQADDIAAAIRIALSQDWRSGVRNDNPPYGRGGNATALIIEKLRAVDPKSLAVKHFYDA